MPIPVNDASQALKTSPEKTEEALQKVLPTVTHYMYRERAMKDQLPNICGFMVD